MASFISVDHERMTAEDSMTSPNESDVSAGSRYDGSAQSYDESAVLMTLIVNSVIFIVLVCGYEVFSRLLPSVYRTNQTHVENGTHRMSLPRPMMQSSAPFVGWIPHVFAVSWTQLRKTCGLDAYFFIRYIRMFFQITAVSGLWAMIVLWPVYSTGDNNAKGWYYLSMANLQQGDWKLWIPAIFMYFVTSYILFVMNEEYKHYIECRQEFLAKGDSNVHPQQGYTLMVEDIPHELRSDQALLDYFEELFPGKVHSAKIVLNVPDLTEAVAERDRVLAKLEKWQAVQVATGNRRTHTVRRKFRLRHVQGEDSSIHYDDTERLPQLGEKVDSIDYYTKYLAVLNDRVSKIQDNKIALATQGDNSVRASEWISRTLGLGRQTSSRRTTMEPAGETVVDDALIVSTDTSMRWHTLAVLRQVGIDFLCGGFLSMHRQLDAVVDTVRGATMSSTGFVTFKDLVSTACAIRAPLSHEAGVLNAQISPEPRDIKWKNAHINRSWSASREWTSNVLLALGAVLWSVPVAAIQAMANLDSLSRLPGLSGLGDSMGDELTAFVNGFLPVVTLLFIIFLLPFALKWVANVYERRKSRSDLEHSVVNRFFWYQLANVYVTATAGSVLDALADILDHPSSAIEILGKTLTTVVGYFIALLITKLLAGLPWVMIRPLALARRIVQKVFCRERMMTQRELDKQNQARTLAYGKEYIDLLLVFLIMSTYACICPIVLPLGALYFLVALLVYKKQLLLVFRSTYESGGALFPSACHRALIALVTGQCCLIFYTVIREGFYQPILMSPLPVYTLYMMFQFKRLYADKGSYLSLERAVELDKQHESNEIIKKFDYYVYRQPILSGSRARPMPYRRIASQEDEASAELANLRADLKEVDLDDDGKVV